MKECGLKTSKADCATEQTVGQEPWKGADVCTPSNTPPSNATAFDPRSIREAPEQSLVPTEIHVDSGSKMQTEKPLKQGSHLRSDRAHVADFEIIQTLRMLCASSPIKLSFSKADQECQPNKLRKVLVGASWNATRKSKSHQLQQDSRDYEQTPDTSNAARSRTLHGARKNKLRQCPTSCISPSYTYSSQRCRNVDTNPHN